MDIELPGSLPILYLANSTLTLVDVLTKKKFKTIRMYVNTDQIYGFRNVAITYTVYRRSETSVDHL